MGGISRKNRARIRRSLLKRDGNYCSHCGLPMELKDFDRQLGMSIDHITPRAFGGGNSLNNLQLMHRRCNEALGQDLHDKIEGGYFKRMLDHEGDF